MKILRITAQGLPLFKKDLDICFYTKQRVCEEDKDSLYRLTDNYYLHSACAFIGINASGKTSVLKVISLALNIVKNEPINHVEAKSILGGAKNATIRTYFYDKRSYVCCLETVIEAKKSKTGEYVYSILSESLWEKPIATVKSKKYLTDFTGMKPVEQRNSDEAYLSDDVSFVIAHNKKANDTVEIFSLLSYTNVNVLPFTEDIPLEVIAFLDPTIYLKKNVGGIPQKERLPLTDEQVDKLLDAIYGLPPYVFVMLGLYAGLRREEILGLQWDSVYLDCEAPYLTVRRAWHTEHNRPVILTELKTKAAHRNVPLPDNLLECLKEAKKTSTSDYVVANRDGDPLSYTQFKRLWQYILTRTTKERCYYRYEDGKRVKHTVKPVLGQKAAHNGNVVYSLDFEVTPHQLRHTYITNLIHASVDPKTVQYLAGHESSKITMDIYAKVKYNRPEQLAGVLEDAFASWD